MPSAAPNKKKESSSNNSNESSYSVGDIVLAKVKGYPNWPGHIVDNSSAPPTVRREKPPKGKTLHLIRFFTAGDFAWTAPKDLSHLTTREVQAYIDSPSKKGGELLNAYKVAANPIEWIARKEVEARDREEQEANVAVDQLASDGEGGSGTKSSAAAKKRKRKSEDGGEETKESKKKAAAEEKSSKKAKLDNLVKSRAGGSKSAAVHSEDEAVEPVAKKSKVAAPPTDDEEPGLSKVKEWRHKLQKIFLGSKVPIPANEMPKCKEYFDEMEHFSMKSSWLADSKLGKVLKRIALLQPEVIPGESDYHFIERSTTIANKWSVQVAAEAAAANGGSGVGPSSSVAKPEEVNGNGIQAVAAPVVVNGGEGSGEVNGNGVGKMEGVEEVKSNGGAEVSV